MHLFAVCQAERARKSSETELSETTQRMAELSAMLTALTADRRRSEAELSSARADVEDALRERTEAADRATRLQVNVEITVVVVYRVARKKPAHFLYAIISCALTSSDIDQFSNVFHCPNQENFCNNTSVATLPCEISMS